MSWRASAPALEVSFVSGSAVELLGYPAQQWKAEPGFLKNHIHQDDWSVVLEAVFEVATEGKVRTLQHRMLAADGSTRWEQTSIWRAKSNGATEVAGLTVDVTSLKQSEQASRDAEARLRGLIENLRDCAVFLLSPEGAVTSWSRASARLLGCSAAEVEGAPLWRFFPEEEVGKGTPARLLEEAHSEGRAAYEGYLVRKPGSPFWGSLSLSEVPDGSGQLRGFSAIATDLNERRKAEQALAEREEQLSLMVDSVQDCGIFMVSPEGRVQRWSRGAQRVSRYRAPEILDTPYSRLFPQDEQDKHTPQRLIEEALQRGSACYEGWLVRKRGSTFWSLLTLSLVESRTGHLRGVSIVFRDVGERKHSEDALRETEHWQRLLLNSLTDYSIAMLSPEGRVSSWSPGAERLKGYRPDEIIGQPFSRLFPSEESERGTPQSLVARAAAEGHAEYEGWLIRKEGAPLWESLTVNAVRNGNGELRGFSLIGKDTTARMQAESAQSLLSEVGVILASSLDYRLTLTRILQLATRAFARWCVVAITPPGDGLEPIAVAHADRDRERALKEALSTPHCAARLRQGLESVLQIGETELRVDALAIGSVTEALGIKDPGILGELSTQSYLCVPLTARGLMLGAMLFVSPPRKRYTRPDLLLAQELGRRTALGVDNARLYEQAQGAIHVRDQILAVVSHDLLNPVSTIQLLAAQLAAQVGDGESAARTTRAAERIRRATDRMILMIRDLLDYSNIEAGRLRIEVSSQEVLPLVAEAIELLQPMAEAQGILLQSELEAPEAKVRCDRERTLQVFSNLIGNAIKFSTRGATVTIGARPEQHRVVFSVSDTGPGIPETDLPHVFDRYWQGAQSLRGTLGLGLAIAKTIVEAQGGTIWAHSTVGEGTRIFFTLPGA